jgi:anti-repressor protein
MNELIRIGKSSKTGKPVVSGRALHAFLEVETPFHKWMPRMFEYGFVENVDWTKLSTDNQDFSYDYILTLNTANVRSLVI